MIDNICRSCKHDVVIPGLHYCQSCYEELRAISEPVMPPDQIAEGLILIESLVVTRDEYELLKSWGIVP